MEMTLFTESRFKEILAWLSGQEEAKPDFADEFINSLGMAYRKRCRGRGRTGDCPGKKLSIKHIMESSGLPAEKMLASLKDTGEKPVISQEDMPEIAYRDSGMDSLVLAKAVLCSIRSNNFPVNRSKVIMISYVIYGVWLAERHERIISEHPQIWKYGPVFPRIYTRLDLNCSGKEEYDLISSRNPDLAWLIRHYSSCLGLQSVSSISAVHTAGGTPWKKCCLANKGKWGIAMDDRDIESWFAYLIARSIHPQRQANSSTVPPF